MISSPTKLFFSFRLFRSVTVPFPFVATLELILTVKTSTFGVNFDCENINIWRQFLTVKTSKLATKFPDPAQSPMFSESAPRCSLQKRYRAMLYLIFLFLLYCALPSALFAFLDCPTAGQTVLLVLCPQVFSNLSISLHSSFSLSKGRCLMSIIIAPRNWENSNFGMQSNVACYMSDSDAL